jgi:hypothetical protein
MFYVFETDETTYESMQAIFDYIDENVDDEGLLLEASPNAMVWCLNGSGEEEEYHAIDRAKSVKEWSSYNHVVVVNSDDNSFFTVSLD